MARKSKQKQRQAKQGPESGRLPRWLKGGLMAAALVGAVGAGAAIVLDPATLPIRAVKVEGRFQHLDESQLQRAVASRVSGGFFNVDLDAVRGAVIDRPWVRSVSVRRMWPDALRIVVTEHEPLARWADDGLVDVSGQWFAADQSQFAQKLPLLSGPDGLQEVVTRRYEEIGELIAPLGMRITELRVNERRAWRMQLDGELQVRLGRDNINERLRRFVRAFPTVLEQRSKRLVSVDLRYTNGLSVRWAAAQVGTEPSSGES